MIKDADIAARPRSPPKKVDFEVAGADRAAAVSQYQKARELTDQILTSNLESTQAVREELLKCQSQQEALALSQQAIERELSQPLGRSRTAASPSALSPARSQTASRGDAFSQSRQARE